MMLEAHQGAEYGKCGMQTFDEVFIDAVAAKVSDVVLARLNRPTIEKRYLSVDEAAVLLQLVGESSVGRVTGERLFHRQRGLVAVVAHGVHGGQFVPS